VNNEVQIPINQYIISKKQFKLVVGKTTKFNTNTKYYDIPTDGIVWSLLQNFLDKPRRTNNHYWEYHSRRIFTKSGIELTSGLINYLRITKARWIESLPLSSFEKNDLHNSMCHSYNTTMIWYV